MTSFLVFQDARWQYIDVWGVKSAGVVPPDLCKEGVADPELWAYIELQWPNAFTVVPTMIDLQSLQVLRSPYVAIAPPRPVLDAVTEFFRLRDVTVTDLMQVWLVAAQALEQLRRGR